jgi:hypothetical protein
MIASLTVAFISHAMPDHTANGGDWTLAACIGIAVAAMVDWLLRRAVNKLKARKQARSQ